MNTEITMIKCGWTRGKYTQVMEAVELCALYKFMGSVQNYGLY